MPFLRIKLILFLRTHARTHAQDTSGSMKQTLEDESHKKNQLLLSR